MKYRYTAKIYFDEGEVANEQGNDIEELYNWMLIKTQGKFGNFNGEITDNKTHKVVKSFRKSPPD
ncbi:MAG: hypothetical protein KIT56_00045 [Gammaproteobacteria bacterium]|nr:hypothetical protein [Gammaproteobacteria bacterium]MCW5582275.1 hypothetical protein [Gammaproteobacteria bacterium]